jgi:hypothetical protein
MAAEEFGQVSAVAKSENVKKPYDVCVVLLCSVS